MRGVYGVCEQMVAGLVSGGSIRCWCCKTFSSHVLNDVGKISSGGQMAGRETSGSKMEMDCIMRSCSDLIRGCFPR